MEGGLGCSSYQPRQMHCTALCGIVREVVLRVTHDAAHRGGGDDGWREMAEFFAGGLEHGEEANGREEDGCDVRVVHVVPFLCALVLPERGLEGRCIGFIERSLGTVDTGIGD